MSSRSAPSSRALPVFARPRSWRRLLPLLLPLVWTRLLPLFAPAATATPVAASGAATDIPARAAGSDSALARHIDSRALREWRETASAEERAALDFLFSWLPASDLAAWRHPAIVEEIQLALRTRRDSPWRDEIPDAVFRAWVLPHRVAQEPIQPWRRTLHERLWPRVQGRTLREAILETNRFCREWVTFAPASPRDQGPLTTMERGWGRCEEESIFFICAARSVGIPARVAWTPWWMAGDGNHAWVEAWDGTGWRFLGACEPAVDLDQAWFREPARRAGIVLSGAYGEDSVAGEPLYSRDEGVSLVNSTPVYGTPGVLRVRWADDPGPAAATARDTVRVQVQIWNYGSLTSLAEFAAGDSILLGPADYFVSAQVGDRAAAAFARVRPSATTLVSLLPLPGEEAPRSLFTGPIRLEIPRPEESATEDRAGARAAIGGTHAPPPPAMDAERLRAWEDSLVTLRRARLRADSVRREEPRRLLAARDATRCAGILATLARVPAREDLWLAFALATPEESWPAVAELLLQMDDKDLLEADTASARAWARESARLREAAAGPAVPDSIWSAFVLSPRIDRQPFDTEILQLPLLRDEGGAILSPRDLHARFAARVRRAAPTRLGHVATPAQTWKSGWATPAAARVGLVGLLRRHGVAARVETGRRWVEVWSDGRWVPCDPFDAGSWDRRSSAVATAYEPRSRLRATFREDDSLFTAVEPGRHFLLARFRNGRFEPDYDSDYRVEGGVLSMEVEPGPCWLFSGIRDPETGEPTFVAHSWDAASGEETELAIDLGARALATASGGATGCSGPPARWAETIRRIGEDFPRDGEPLLLFAWDEVGEPSTRVAGALREAIDSGALRVRIGSILVSSSAGTGSGPASHPLAPADLPGRTLTRSEAKQLFPEDPRTQLPFLLLLDGERRPRLCLAGLRVDAADAVRRALREIPPRGDASR